MNTNSKIHSTGIILAGGKSSRMGQEKGLVLHHGIPFIQYSIQALAKITDTIIIVTNNPLYTQFGYPCIPDHIPDCGPVGGIYTGLYHSTTTQNIVVSCDIPWVTTETLMHLSQYDLEDAQVTYYENNPLIGWYSTTLLPILEIHLKQKQLKLQTVLAHSNVHRIPIPQHLQNTLQNINTIHEYKKALSCN